MGAKENSSGDEDSIAPSGAYDWFAFVPRLTPWAIVFRHSVADFTVPFQKLICAPSGTTCEKLVGLGREADYTRAMSVFSCLPIFAALFLLGTILRAGSAEKPVTAHDFSWIEQRVQELQPTARERRIDEIGWAKDIRAAEKLAKENNRPVFLFTHDGRMNIGRC